jgi:hypothetical protein
MSSSRHDSREGFLGRWSRVKSEARAAEAAPPVPAPAQPAANDEPPVLPPLEELTLDSDFSGFFHPKVDEDLRRSALRKLFSDPHFNVMDGLDTYIDDYTKTEPIPAAMLAGLKQAQNIFKWAAETEEEAQVRRSAVVAPESDEDPAADVMLPGTLPSEQASEIEASSVPEPEPIPRSQD